MISILITVLTWVLLVVAALLCAIILAQPSKSDAGMSAMGGGMMESTFGPDTSNVLTGLTVKAAVAFFVLSFVIYLGYIHQRAHPAAGRNVLPNISVPATLPAAAPKATAPAATPAATVPATPAPNAAATTKPGAPAPKTP
jgi:preprotein translocase subunit SecG